MSTGAGFVHRVEGGLPGRALAQLKRFSLLSDADLTAVIPRRGAAALRLAGRRGTRAIGDPWLAQQRSLALAVPSAVLPDSTNLLIDPLHPGAAAISVREGQPFRFDPRLRPER